MRNTHQICLAAQASLGFAVFFKVISSAKMMSRYVPHIVSCSKDGTSLVNSLSKATESRKWWFTAEDHRRGIFTLAFRAAF